MRYTSKWMQKTACRKLEMVANEYFDPNLTRKIYIVNGTQIAYIL